jgi:putative phosphoribosyl transferase
MTTNNEPVTIKPVRIPVDGWYLPGDLGVPLHARGIVVFAHGSGSSRHSARNRHVARYLEREGFATLLIDLLTSSEEEIDARTHQFRFDIPLLAQRLVGIIDWLATQPEVAALPIGLFGASTGGGAALSAAAARPKRVAAVVSRGGRPDMAGRALPHVLVPTLLIVGGEDTAVVEFNHEAMARMRGPVSLEIVPGATHLFEEAGALETVAALAARWFQEHAAARGGETSKAV